MVSATLSKGFLVFSVLSVYMTEGFCSGFCIVYNVHVHL